MSGFKGGIPKGSFRSIKLRKRFFDIISLIIVIILAVLVMMPLWYVFRSSLMRSSDIFRWPPVLLPPDWLWSNYDINPLTFDFFKYLGNTLIIVVPCVVFGTSTAIMCGYAFARLRFRGKKFIFSLCVGSMLLPSMVTLIPLYIGWSTLGLVGTYYPLIIPFLFGGGAFNIFLLRQFMLSIPRDFDEAAMIDGAGHIRILVSVLLPMIKPAVIVVALLIFIANWNDLLQQMIYISNKDMYTLTLGLTTFLGSFKSDYAGMFAATCLTFLPTVIVYLFGQRFFVEGIVMSGIKN
ncbi:MAG: carbohydrate ABC transporter permease [Oscillospiraceae bacterium]|nr:carbohydrate ABC transporter permease [Oscillospiraceae bacterium]